MESTEYWAVSDEELIFYVVVSVFTEYSQFFSVFLELSILLLTKLRYLKHLQQQKVKLSSVSTTPFLINAATCLQ
jgi:hypothetical protein